MATDAEISKIAESIELHDGSEIRPADASRARAYAQRTSLAHGGEPLGRVIAKIRRKLREIRGVRESGWCQGGVHMPRVGGDSPLDFPHYCAYVKHLTCLGVGLDIMICLVCRSACDPDRGGAVAIARLMDPGVTGGIADRAIFQICEVGVSLVVGEDNGDFATVGASGRSRGRFLARLEGQLPGLVGV